MDALRARAKVGCAIGIMALALHAAPASGETFDFHNGNAPVEVVIPTVIPVIYGFVWHRFLPARGFADASAISCTHSSRRMSPARWN